MLSNQYVPSQTCASFFFIDIRIQQYDARNTAYGIGQPQQLHHARSEANMRQVSKPPLLPVLDTSVQRHPMPTMIPAGRRESSSYTSISHGPSPVSITSSYGVPYASHQYQDSPMSSSGLRDPQWRDRVPANMDSNSPATNIGTASTPTSTTSAYHRGAPWASSASPSIPPPILEQSDSSERDLRFVPYDPTYEARNVSGNAPAYTNTAGQVPLTTPQERIGQRAVPLVSRTMSASTVEKPPPSPVEPNDPLPRRGRRPVRKSASEQQLHEQQRQHQHQLQLTHIQPQRTRARHRQASGATTESGPIRGIPKEDLRRKSSSSAASIGSRGDTASPLQGPGYLAVRPS